MDDLLKVIYEDNHLIVVIKPSGILSQADITNDIDMLTLVKQYLAVKYQKPGNVYLGLVHRLDRMTSGLMVFAKTSKAASRLSEQIRSKEFHKKYLAVVEGVLEKGGTLKNYLYKNEKEVKSYVVSKDYPNAKEAYLTYHVLDYNDNESILDVDLITGRHHQIRVQLSNIKHPLVGDTLYGSSVQKPIKLHTYYLSFSHPTTKELMEFIEYPTWYKKEKNNDW